MRHQSTGQQSMEHIPPTSQRHRYILTILMAVNALFLGGCIALLIVNRLLLSQLDVYVNIQSMAAVSTILDFADDLLRLYIVFGGGLLVLVLVTVSVWSWMKVQARLLRYGVPLLCSIVLVVLGAMGLQRVRQVPAIPPTTPTPVGLAPSVGAGHLGPTPTLMSKSIEETAAVSPLAPASLASMPDARQTMNNGDLTGVDELDRVIRSVVEGDTITLRSLVQFAQTECTFQDGLGGPPKCQDGEVEGEVVEILPFLGPEGHFIRKENIDSWVGIDATDLYAVYKVSDSAFATPIYPSGTYAIAFINKDRFLITTLQIVEGRIVRVDTNLGNPPIIQQEDVGAYLIPPRNLDS